MKTTQKLILLVLPLIIFISCTKDHDNPVDYTPKCRVVSQSDLIFPEFGFPQITFTVENYGKLAPAYNISIQVKLKKGNYIVDESYVNMGTLEKGESKSDNVIFTKIKKDSNYDHVEISFYWYDSEDNCFQ